LAAPSVLLAAVPLGVRWGPRVRDACLASFVVASAVTWCSAPATLGPRHVDWMRGAAGVLGWALFGMAWAGPPLTPPEEIGDGKLSPRRPLPRGDAAYLAVGAAAAGALQLVGWDVVPLERALLVRCVALASGVGLLSSVAEVAAFRLAAASPIRGRHGLRRGLVWMIAIGALAILGALSWPDR